MKLLQIEFKKLVGNKSFWVFTLLFLVFLPVIVILIPSIVGQEMNGIEIYPLMPKTAETTWYYTCLVSSYFSMFILSFILIYHISNEYAYRTVRQNIIDGLTRWDFVKAKIILLLVLGLLATIYVFLVGFFSSWYFESVPKVNSTFMDGFAPFFGGENKPPEFGGLFEGVEHVFGFLLQIIAYFSFASLMGFLLKKGALAVLLYFVSFIVEWIIGVQMQTNALGDAYEYFPLNSISRILPNPGFEAIIQGMSAPDALTPINILMVVIWTIVFLFLTRLVFFKRDIS